ncbi:LacI family transcriptional regulator [Burkholderia seminalis]|nr:LacI family transcriptional regulator [Burkholderia seminalis]
MTRIFNPPHPGETLRDDVLPALGLSVTEAASQLGVTRAALSRILHGHAGISPSHAASRSVARRGRRGVPLCVSSSVRG